MKTKLFGIVFLLFVVFQWGCQQVNEEENLTENKSGAGKLVIMITDAPFPADMVEEANITVKSVVLKKKDADDNGEEKSGDDDPEELKDSSIVVVLEKDTTINLLALANGVTAVLAEKEIPAGYYDEIRVIISEAGILLKDGREFDLKVPSGSASGLKIKIKPDLFIQEGADVNLLLDVDLSRSFVALGNDKGKKEIKGFIFKPVIRAVNQDKTGQVSGMVKEKAGDIKIAGAEVYLISGSDTLSTAITSDTGYYAIIGVPEGNYRMDCEKEGYTKVSYPVVNVKAGKITETNFELEKTE